MQAKIHPKYFDSVEIRCSCGNVVVSGSTHEKLKTELCSKCHPFYTGQQKLVDTAGRVDKFEAKRKKASAMKEASKKRVEEKKKKPEAYKEKVIPVEVLERAAKATKKTGKWGAPLGKTPAEEAVKEAKKTGKKASGKIIMKKKSTGKKK